MRGMQIEVVADSDEDLEKWNGLVGSRVRVLVS